MVNSFYFPLDSIIGSNWVGKNVKNINNEQSNTKINKKYVVQNVAERSTDWFPQAGNLSLQRNLLYLLIRQRILTKKEKQKTHFCVLI